MIFREQTESDFPQALFWITIRKVPAFLLLGQKSLEKYITCIRSFHATRPLLSIFRNSKWMTFESDFCYFVTFLIHQNSGYFRRIWCQLNWCRVPIWPGISRKKLRKNGAFYSTNPAQSKRCFIFSLKLAKPTVIWEWQNVSWGTVSLRGIVIHEAHVLTSTCFCHNKSTVSLEWLREALSFSTPHQFLSITAAGITSGNGSPAQELIV